MMGECITYFVPGKKYYEVASALVDNAQSRIYLVMYHVSMKGPVQDLVDHIVSKAGNVSDIQFILNYRGNDSLKAGVLELAERVKDSGIRIYAMDKTTVHAKVLIADNWLLLGSSNLSVGGMEKNWEANVVTNSPHALSGAISWFEELRGDSEQVI